MRKEIIFWIIFAISGLFLFGYSMQMFYGNNDSVGHILEMKKDQNNISEVEEQLIKDIEIQKKRMSLLKDKEAFEYKFERNMAQGGSPFYDKIIFKENNKIYLIQGEYNSNKAKKSIISFDNVLSEFSALNKLEKLRDMYQNNNDIIDKRYEKNNSTCYSYQYATILCYDESGLITLYMRGSGMVEYILRRK